MPLAELAKFIDWTFFFSAWELKGRFPAILEHPQYGAAARELYEHAQALLQRIIDEKLLTARGVYGFWPANTRRRRHRRLHGRFARAVELARLPMLRQQEIIADEQAEPIAGRLHRAARERRARLSRHVRRHRRPRRRRTGARGSSSDHDDYNAIMVKALADRLAEAFAEYLHAQARKDWGYGEREQLSSEDLIAEKYRGIRPAYGYPACPDHSEKFKLFELLDAARQGITLTESGAMLPAAIGQRPVFLASAGEVLQRRRGSGAISWSPTRSARACRSRRSSAGWRPNLAYDPAAMATRCCSDHRGFRLQRKAAWASGPRQPQPSAEAAEATSDAPDTAPNSNQAVSNSAGNDSTQIRADQPSDDANDHCHAAPGEVNLDGADRRSRVGRAACGWLRAGVVAAGGGERAGEPRPSGSRHREPARLRAGRPPQRHGRSGPVDHHRRPPAGRAEHPIAGDHAAGAAGQHRAGRRSRRRVRPAAAAEQRARPPRGAADLEQQIRKREAQERAAAAKDDSEIKVAQSSQSRAELEMVKNPMIAKIQAEKNMQRARAGEGDAEAAARPPTT